VLARALLPAAALGDWLRDEGAVTLDGVSVLRAADQQEEAAAIALVLRQAIVTPGRRAALVTPDRGWPGGWRWNWRAGAWWRMTARASRCMRRRRPCSTGCWRGRRPAGCRRWRCCRC
jgi:hypothetical protein